MKNLSSLLKKFSDSLNRDSLLKESALAAIKNTTNISLKESDLAIKNSVLEISASPAVKNEVKLKEARILASLPQISKIFYK